MVPRVTLFWGKSIEIMFPNWPGQSFYSYSLALAFVFIISLTVEWLSHAQLIKSKGNQVTAGLKQTLMYAIRVALAYLVMLAVMSSNVGVLLAAVTGYSVGFFVFGSQVFKNPKIQPYEGSSDLPPLNC